MPCGCMSCSWRRPKKKWNGATAAWRAAIAGWHVFDAEAAKAEEIEIPIQVNGKVRSRLHVPPTIDDAELERLALADPAVQPYIAGKTVKKVVIAKGRLVSI